MKSKFSCPIPFSGLSISAGHRRRLCCHDQTAESEELDTENILTSPLNDRIKGSFERGEIPVNCQSCYQIEKQGADSPRQEYINKFTFDRTKIQYLDYTVDNICNLKCRSCRPEYSSSLKKEFEILEIPFKNYKEVKESREIEEKIINNLKDKHSLCLFFEGTRGEGKELLPFRKGAFHFSFKNNIPLKPFFLFNTENVISKNRNFFDVRPDEVFLIVEDSWSFVEENFEKQVEEFKSYYIKRHDELYIEYSKEL